MPDLPMAQIPTFQLPGPAQITQQPGLVQGLASGLNQGAQLGIQSRQVAVQQQAVQQQALQQKMQMVDSLIKNGLEYPKALLPMFWPTIAKTMNEINPAYQMDPTKPPSNLQSWGESISQTLDATNAGVISLPQADQTVQNLNKQHFDQPIPPQVGLEGQQPQQSQQPLAGEDAYAAAYRQALNLPRSQIGPAIEALQKSPQAMEMQSSLEQQRQLSLQKNTFQNENMQSLNRTFLENTKDQAQQLPDLIDFTTSMSPRLPPNPTPQDKADLVVHQKIGLLKYMQLNVPASRRPPNLQAMDNISREDLVQAHAEQAWKQLFKTGAPLTEEQQDAILKNGITTGLASEKMLSDAESSWANRAQNNGVDPLRALQNIRPSSIPSTSKYFPNPGPNWQTAHVGQIVVSPTGPKVYRGGDRTDPKNWTSIGQ